MPASQNTKNHCVLISLLSGGQAALPIAGPFVWSLSIFPVSPATGDNYGSILPALRQSCGEPVAFYFGDRGGELAWVGQQLQLQTKASQAIVFSDEDSDSVPGMSFGRAFFTPFNVKPTEAYVLRAEFAIKSARFKSRRSDMYTLSKFEYLPWDRGSLPAHIADIGQICLTKKEDFLSVICRIH